MATERTTLTRKLLVNVTSTETKGGITSEADKSLTFSRIKVTATDDQLLAAGNAIAALQVNGLNSISVTESSKLSSGA